MVESKKRIVRANPDGVIRQQKRELELQRNQLVLDLTRPEWQEFEWQPSKIFSVCRTSAMRNGMAIVTYQPGSSISRPIVVAFVD